MANNPVLTDEFPVCGKGQEPGFCLSSCGSYINPSSHPDSFTKIKNWSDSAAETTLSSYFNIVLTLVFQNVIYFALFSGCSDSEVTN